MIVPIFHVDNKLIRLHKPWLADGQRIYSIQEDLFAAILFGHVIIVNGFICDKNNSRGFPAEPVALHDLAR